MSLLHGSSRSEYILGYFTKNYYCLDKSAHEEYAFIALPPPSIYNLLPLLPPSIYNLLPPSIYNLLPLLYIIYFPFQYIVYFPFNI